MEPSCTTIKWSNRLDNTFYKFVMIEDLLYSATEHGKRSDLLDEVSKLRVSKPKELLDRIYEEAYQNIMNT